MAVNNEDKQTFIIKRIDESSSNIETWPEWKREINLTDASTFTVNTSGGNDHSSSNEHEE